MAYLIKIIHRLDYNPEQHGYYSLVDYFTTKKNFARVFCSRLHAETYAESFKQTWPNDDVYVIDEENDIGTYFSTCDKKPKLKGILVNTMCIILIPILLPIVGIIMIKEYIMKLIGKEYR